MRSWISLGVGIMLALMVGTAGQAGTVYTYTFEFDPLDVVLGNQPFHYNAADFSFTTPTLLTLAESDTTVNVNPPGNLNGFPVSSVRFDISVPPNYDFFTPVADVDFNQPVGSVGAFFARVQNADQVGIYMSANFSRGIVVDPNHNLQFFPANGRLTISAVPEPSTFVLAVIAGLICLPGVKRGQKRKKQGQERMARPEAPKRGRSSLGRE